MIENNTFLETLKSLDMSGPSSIVSWIGSTASVVSISFAANPVSSSNSCVGGQIIYPLIGKSCLSCACWPNSRD